MVKENCRRLNTFLRASFIGCFTGSIRTTSTEILMNLLAIPKRRLCNIDWIRNNKVIFSGRAFCEAFWEKREPLDSIKIFMDGSKIGN